jgi:hypothetical protein
VLISKEKENARVSSIRRNFIFEGEEETQNTEFVYHDTEKHEFFHKEKYLYSFNGKCNGFSFEEISTNKKFIVWENAKGKFIFLIKNKQNKQN